jgi:capsular exopolysaccharide synthesis family protein
MAPSISTLHRPLVKVHDRTTGTGITPGFLWFVLRRWFKFALPLGILLTSLGVTGVMLSFKREYRSEAWVQISKHRPIVAFKIDESSADFVETQKQLLRSPPVLANVLSRPEVARLPDIQKAKDARKWIEQQMEVTPLGRSELYAVAFRSSDPEQSRIIVDAIVQSYFSLQAFQSSRQVSKLVEVLQLEKERQVARVTNLEERISELAKKNADGSSLIVNPYRPTLVDVNPLYQTLQQRLAETEAERQMHEAQIAVFQELGGESPLANSDLDRAVAELPDVVRLEGKAEAARKSLSALRPESNAYTDAQRNLTNWEHQIKAARINGREDLLKAHKDQASSLREDRLAQYKAQSREYEIRENKLKEQIDAERRKLEHKTGNRYELEFLTSDLNRAKEVFQKLEDRVFALSIEYLSPDRPEQVQVIHPAEAPAAPVQAYPFKQLAIVSCLAFALPYVVFGAFELRARRMYDASELFDNGQLKMVSEIASIPARPLLAHGRARRQFERDRAIFEEGVESLRNMLTVSPDWANAKVLAVVSAVPGEGKTSIASQLAAGWSRNEHSSTLLIDGDIRDPDVHGIFSVPNSPGLVAVLAEKSSLDDAIIHWDGSLDILPAGVLLSRPHPLLSGDRFTHIVNELRARYSRIVIDLAPLLSASEVLPMLKAVDGVLLCARKDHSRAAHVQLACERLEKIGVQRIVGVFSGITSHSYMYNYGDYVAWTPTDSNG